jgi:hypothetical protein
MAAISRKVNAFLRASSRAADLKKQVLNDIIPKNRHPLTPKTSLFLQRQPTTPRKSANTAQKDPGNARYVSAAFAMISRRPWFKKPLSSHVNLAALRECFNSNHI